MCQRERDLHICNDSRKFIKFNVATGGRKFILTQRESHNTPTILVELTALAVMELQVTFMNIVCIWKMSTDSTCINRYCFHDHAKHIFTSKTAMLP